MASMDDLAVHVRNVLGLPLQMDAPTPGRGNCFFAAMVQQMNNRNELKSSNVYTAASLRKRVCEFALTKSHPVVQRLAEEHDANTAMSLQAPWESFFTNMKNSGVFAEGPVLYCTALLLQMDIAVISFGNTELNPYMLVPGHHNTPAKPPVFLGNVIGLQFQSFLPHSSSMENLQAGVCAPD